MVHSYWQEEINEQKKKRRVFSSLKLLMGQPIINLCWVVAPRTTQSAQAFVPKEK